MTRKDYIRLAEFFRTSRPIPGDMAIVQWEQMLYEMCDMLRLEYRNFNRDKFLAAAFKETVR